MRPKISYTIWFSQRTGSTLLCKALEATGIAGQPQELFNCKPGLRDVYHAASYEELQKDLWSKGATGNSVFGMKQSFSEPQFGQLIEELRRFPGCPTDETSRPAIWEHAFPNHRHIFMTRRNKIRLAVSWWKAIQTQEWHLQPGQSHKEVDLSNSYSFNAINHLYNECSLREAGIQEFFAEGRIVPFNIIYEDFMEQYEPTIRRVLAYLDLADQPVTITPPRLAQTADQVSEEWVQRFRKERQEDWPNKGW